MATGGRLVGKVVFITGAAQGMGRASALVRNSPRTQQHPQSACTGSTPPSEMPQGRGPGHSHGCERGEAGRAAPGTAGPRDRHPGRHESGERRAAPAKVQ